jgi:hypothetical protein
MEKSHFNREMEEFGTKMYVLGILSIISIFTAEIIQLAIFIILLLSLKHIKEANLELEDERLEKFRKNVIYAVIVGIVGGIVIIIIGAIFAMLFLVSIPGFPFNAPLTVSEFQQLAPMIRILLFILLGGLPVGGVALGFLIMGWKNLHLFFEKNSGLFPNRIGREAVDGSEKMRKAYLLLLITLIIGAVLDLIAIVVFPQIISLISAFIAKTTPQIELIVGLGLIFGIPGVAMGILGLISFILMILAYFDLSNLKNL